MPAPGAPPGLDRFGTGAIWQPGVGGTGAGAAGGHVWETLLVGSASTLAVAPASGAAAARYHPTRDFTPLAFFGISTMGLLVSRDSGVSSTRELLDRLRANPGRFSFAGG